MKTQINKPITQAQMKKIYALLNQQGIIKEKATMVHSISNGRTQSTKELTCDEAKQLITFLLGGNIDEAKCRVVFEAIYRIAWELDIIYGDTEDDYQMNIAKLNMFCRQRGTIKKNLTDMNLIELRRTQRQFEAIRCRYNQ